MKCTMCIAYQRTIPHNKKNNLDCMDDEMLENRMHSFRQVFIEGITDTHLEISQSSIMYESVMVFQCPIAMGSVHNNM